MDDFLTDIPADWTAELAFGAEKSADKWENKITTLDGLKWLGTTASSKTREDKDGLGFTQGSTNTGKRTKEAMDALYIVGVDIDNGSSFESALDMVRSKGLACVAYTTFSHLKTVTEVLERQWDQFLSDSPGATAADYLKRKLRYIPTIADTATVTGRARYKVQISHAPMPKFRLLFVLAKPWRAEERTPEAWKRAYRNFCRWLGVEHDPACEDVTRFFYTPSHSEGVEPKAAWIEGKAIDVFALPDADAVADALPSREMVKARAVSGSDLMTKLERWAGKFGQAFQIADFIEVHAPERLRPASGDSYGKRHIECPFEDEHSTQGGFGTFVMNATESNTGSFVIDCRHSCKARYPDRLTYLAKMIRDGWFSEEDLFQYDEAWYVAVDEVDFSELDAIRDGKARSNGPAALERLNREFALVVMKDKIRILREVEGQSVPNFLPVEGFHQLMAPVKLEITTKDGGTAWVQASKRWMEWTGRRQYDGVAFEPGGVKGNLYNLWTGLPVEMKAGDWSLLRGHIHANVCGGNDEYFRWFMAWMAQIVQEPGKKLGSAVILQGKKGTGKTKVFDWFRKGLGRYALKVSDPKHLIGSFNAHHETLLLLVAEEGFWAGNKTAEGRLKDMVTSDTTVIERKGVDAYEVSNFTRLAITSNEGWVVPATIGERRYFVLKVGDARAKDTAFFAAIDRQMETGGLEAMFHELANWSIEGVDLRNPPETPALAEQINNSFEPWENWFIDAITDGQFVDDEGDIVTDGVWDDEAEPLKVRVNDLRNAFATCMDRYGHGAKVKASAQAFGQLVTEYLPGVVRDRQRDKMNGNRPAWFYIIPSLNSLRKHYDEKCGLKLG